MLGNLLQGRDQQYVAAKDEITNTWRVLDTWHVSLKTTEVEDDVPDDSPAVTVLTEGAFIALIKEAARTGMLENASLNADTVSIEIDQLNGELMEMKEKLVIYEKENISLKQNLQESHNLSEPFRIKSKAMEAVLKLAAMSDIERISED